MAADPDQSAPTPPASSEATGQRLPAPGDDRLVASPSLTSEFLEGGVQTALVGLGSTNTEVVLSQIAVASMVTILNQQDRRIRELGAEIRAERNSRQEIQNALAEMRSRAEIAETRLQESEGKNVLRDVSLTVSGALLGLAVGIYEKLGAAGTIVGVGFAVALIIGVLKSKRSAK
jgi:hypothetical protein